MDPQELRLVFTLANPFKEGDLAVGGSADDRLREDARRTLAATTIGAIRRTVLVDDGVTAALDRLRDRRLDGELDPLTVGRLKAILLGRGAASWSRKHRDALSSEVVAAIVKVMSDDELSQTARALFNPLAGPGVTVGASRHFGSRIQPNSAGDDEEEILFSILEGLSYGCGDVVVGVNPAADELETIVMLERLLERVVDRLELPTRYCVLSDILKQRDAQAHTRVDVGFQSLAGTSRALAGMVGLDADGLFDVARNFDGLYFETGQGSAVTNGAAEGVDMVTLEARAYGLARSVARSAKSTPRSQADTPWMIVNDVAGFIGPEVFTTAEQLERACLEDSVMAKLQGITMGLDVCATFHMGIDPPTLQQLTGRIARRAAPAYLMAVAGNADPMLGYLTTSFREHPRLRRHTGRDITSAMRRRLRALDVLDHRGEPQPGIDTVARLYAKYARAGGSRASTAELDEYARRRVGELRDRGFDLGVLEAADADARLDRIYRNARSALYAHIEDAVIRDVMPGHVHVRTTANSRDEYLAQPSAGECLCRQDAAAIASLYEDRPPQVQLIVSDGLNANAINEHLRTFLPPLRRLISAAGHHLGRTDIVVRNGRVRVGYEIGRLVGAVVIVHVIGERPGTGLNTLSIYVTYGRDETGRSRWSRQLDHSVTTAICGVHPGGKPPEIAAAEVARAVRRILEQKRSGVFLTS